MINHLSVIKTNKNLKYLVSAKFLSDIGSQMQRFGLPWLVYEYTSSGSLMALNFTLTLIPGLLFGIIDGKIADIVDRKKILILGDIISGLTTICLFGLHLIEPNISVIIIFVLTFILSAISSFYTPAFTAILPNIVKKDEVVDSNSLFSLFDSIVSLIGPVFATLIIGVMGAWITLLINAGSFILSGFILFHLKYVNDDNVATANKSHWNFKNMLTVFADFSWLKFYLYIMVVLYFSLGCIGSILQYYFIHNLHLKGIYLGLTFVLFEFVPVLLASLLINYLIAKFSYKFSIVLGVGVFAISIITMGLSTNYLIVVLSGMVQNFFGTVALISWESIRQERIPSNTLGTVSGVVVTVQSVLTPIGGIIASILLSKINVQNIFIYSGLFCLILTLIIYGVFEFNDVTG